MAASRQAATPKQGKPGHGGDNRRMALRLFRTTGYSTLLMPGEARLGMHPARMVASASLWLGLVCNVSVWRLLGDGPALAARPAPWLTVLGSAALITGASGLVLSLLGWRRTLKPAVTLALLAGALSACALWSRQLPVAALWQGPPGTLLPDWTSFMRWQVLALFGALGLLPVVWAWNVAVRRLPGPAQLQSNLTGAAIAAAVFALGLLLPA